MPTCKNCGAELEAEDLVRHHYHHLLVVHCPQCRFAMGYYRDPAADDVAGVDPEERR